MRQLSSFILNQSIFNNYNFKKKKGDMQDLKN